MDYQVCTHWNVRDLLRMQGRSQLTPPREFQRGPKWSRTQKKLYIDSLLRGYPSPAFYFHCTQPDAVIRHDTRLDFGVVDGQQRLNAMEEFRTGAWALLKSPETKPGGSKHFPVETVRDPEPEWCGLRFSDFSDDLKRRFVYLTLPVIVVKTMDLTVGAGPVHQAPGRDSSQRTGETRCVARRVSRIHQASRRTPARIQRPESLP